MLQATWHQLTSKSIGKDHYWDLSVFHRLTFEIVNKLLPRYAKGNLLDLGAGKLAFKNMLAEFATNYHSLDNGHSECIDVIADMNDKLPFQDSSFDTVFCSSVLEHIEDPVFALREMHRILKPEGSIILLVPFLFYLHDCPKDYWRFSNHIIRRLAEKEQFTIVEELSFGGIFHLLLNIMSIFMTAVLYSIRLRTIIPFSSKLLLTISGALDSAFHLDHLAPNMYVFVLKKTSSGLNSH